MRATRAALLLLLPVATISLGTPAHAAPTCAGAVATITGTAGDDDLKGTTGDDVVVLFAGNDTFDGRGGNDVICGNQGNDEIKGGPGNDRLLGGWGDDDLDGGYGDDHVAGHGGDDWLRAGPGTDTYLGGAGEFDALDYWRLPGPNGIHLDAHGTASGDNVQHDFSGIEAYFGSRHADWMAGTPGDDYLDGNDGANTIQGYDGNDTLVAAGGVVRGGRGDDFLQAQGHSPRMYGNAGADYLQVVDTPTFAGHTTPLINGGPGFDRLDLRYRNAGVDLDLASHGGTFPVYAAEMIVGTRFRDVLRGSSWTNEFHGHMGDDLLIGRGGEDWLLGNGGADRMFGNAGPDHLFGGVGRDSGWGGPGRDECRTTEIRYSCP